MPVKVIIDTSSATPAEQASFTAAAASPVGALAQGAAAQGYGFEYRAGAAAAGSIAPADVYKETMATIRYYGGVRYIFLPIFLTGTAALIAQYFKADNDVPLRLMASAGALVAFILLVFEISLSWNIQRLWAQVGHMIDGSKVFAATAGVDPLPQRRPRWLLKLLRVLLVTPYLLGLGFWLYLFVYRCL